MKPFILCLALIPMLFSGCAPFVCPDNTHLDTSEPNVKSCIDPEGKKHGPWKFSRAHGATGLEGQYEKDARTGMWKAWHVNGETESEGHYRKGKMQGTWRHWHPNGKLAVFCAYKAGKLHGVVDKPIDILQPGSGGEAYTAVLDDTKGNAGGLPGLQHLQPVGLKNGRGLPGGNVEHLRSLGHL